MTDWNGLLEFMNTEKNFNSHNGIRVTKIEDGYCEAEVLLTANGKNPQGVAHGSLIFALADVVTGVAAVTTGKGMLTLSASINFMHAVADGTVHAVARRVREGHTTGVFSAEIYDDAGRLAAVGSFTVYYTGELQLPEDWEKIPK